MASPSKNRFPAAAKQRAGKHWKAEAWIAKSS